MSAPVGEYHTMLKGKNIILGITGGIAAYKSAFLVRLLTKAGAYVQVIMTPAARDFITPLTLSTLSGNPVLCHFTPDNKIEAWNSHVELGLRADLMLVAPATANTLAKMANGICDNLLLAVYLSFPANQKVYFAPAMDLDMYQHPTIQANIKKLQSFGNLLLKPDTGELASGLVGEGRMAEPEAIVDKLITHLKKKLPLTNKKVLITAGPTYEAIDPVRFISNHSSGKMGFAIAEEASKQGAEVTLLTGPVSLNISHPNIERINVVSASEMYKQCLTNFPTTDITIMTAAVADYTPAQTAQNKIKKQKSDLILNLKQTKDILFELGKNKTKKQLLIGFALETGNELENAKAKLKKKNLDFIVLNSLKEKGACFKHDTNKITIIDKNNQIYKFELKTKQKVAKDILNKVNEMI